ncbi:type II toxin-antitoxin system RelE/ParE family toxin [Apibacter sp. HY039]|uniref:type II toxin-antitoxin system RelE/ParE family toxin n=1 Tax=Apibacter sp. HY039 TaxID=2501476 RepID=UPI000FEBCE10|nr:type II toxin-antitoxin system RelE/ParE family toxin [Apibacter sp. HY039]
MKKSYVIHLSEQAQTNINKFSKYYQDISESLKTRFINELVKCIDLLKENPLHHQIRYRNIRIAFTSTFPYGIHFIIENKNIYILDILHTRQFFQ